MPRKTVTILTDDLDGKELPDDTSPVTLSLGRTTYSLYLSEKNHGKLLEVLTPFIDGAETTTTSAPRPASKSASNDDDNKSARSWAQESGVTYKAADGKEKTLGNKGRIPNEVMNAWRAAGSPEMGAKE